MQEIRVLMVDDEQDDRLLFGRMLQRAGDWQLDFREAANGLDAEALIRTGSDVDVILLDFKLPCNTGLELLQTWTQTFPELPAVIILTGQGSEGLAAKALEAGAFEYLSKQDCTAEELALAVRYAARVTQLRQALLRQNELRLRAETELREALLGSGELSGMHPSATA